MLLGVDVSKWNYGWNPSNATKPIHYVIQRASYGGGTGAIKDEHFEDIYVQALKIPVRGFYHYYSSHVHWKLQADAFLGIVGDKDYHFLAVDYERAYNTLDKRTIAEFAEMVKYLKEKTNKRVLVYFNMDVYFDAIAGYGYADWANTQDVWYAQYPYGSPSAPKLPAGLDKWVIWQWGGADVESNEASTAGIYYGGGLRGIDLNWFDGTEQELKSYFGVSETLPIPEPISPIGKVTVQVLSLNVRQEPNTNSAVVGKKFLFQSVNVYDILEGADAWALTDDGFIALRYQGAYLTSWRPAVAVTGKIVWIKPRPLSYDGPAVVAGSDAPRQNHPHYPIDDRWQTWIKSLSNYRSDCWELFSAKDVGPSKGFNDLGKLIYIPATWSFNVVSATGKKDNGWVEVKCVNMNNGIPANMSHETHPTLIGVMTTSTKDGNIMGFEQKNGIPSPWNSTRDPLMSYADTLWLPEEFTDDKCVIRARSLNVRSSYGTHNPVIASYTYGDSVDVLEVKHYGNDIWARSNRGWFALKYNDAFYTSWKVV